MLGSIWSLVIGHVPVAAGAARLYVQIVDRLHTVFLNLLDSLYCVWVGCICELEWSYVCYVQLSHFRVITFFPGVGRGICEKSR